ncbi:MAG: GGDEF domain-containing protein [Rhodospirillales bacterium]|nr:GGDEF domain-containing protein [Rhodospirillales bacterium]
MAYDDLSRVLADEMHRRRDGGPSPSTVNKASGETVIRAGGTGETMFVIQVGEAEILNDGLVLDVVGPGGVVGEMALVDGSLRSATVRARTDLRLMPISKADFGLLIRSRPEFGLYVMKVMSLRLRLMNTRLGNAIEDISARQEIERELRAMAARDPLTGTSNRKHFAEMGAIEVERSQRHGRELSIAMLDVDHFKVVNDTYGHACGDSVLRSIVEAAQDELRTGDILGRVGGEEFAFLMPETGITAGLAIAERIRQRIAGQTLAWDGKTFELTASIGVAAWNPGEPTVDPALARADESLYAAKDQGRNRVVAYGN